jgi:hypothetical protein
MPQRILRLGCAIAALAFTACGGARPTSGEALDASLDARASEARPPFDSGGSVSYVEGDAAFAITADAGFGACAASVEQAQPRLLDLALLLDTSGSMNDLAAPGQSKWQALVQALTAFVQDPASAGLGVGVQYFPVPPAGVPAACTSSAECGAAGPCLVGQCDDGTGLACATRDDCFFGASCRTAMACAADSNFVCTRAGSACGSDGNGFDLGACVVASPSYCASSDSCDASDYAAPALAIAPLPAAAGALVASLATQQPHGGTPTPAALQGALDAAAAYARSHPAHTVAAILATDGVPDEVASPSGPFCDETDPAPANATLAMLAAAAAASTPAVRTFALGVFAPDEVDAGVASLVPIAASGGADQPFIVETRGAADAGAVESQLVGAFNRIRAANLPCQFSVPDPEAGTPDFDRVNVRVTAGGAASDPPYVVAPTACGAAEGWTYDVDPATGAVPTTIDVCPATCARLHDDPTARVDILLGCKTVVR